MAELVRCFRESLQRMVCRQICDSPTSSRVHASQPDSSLLLPSSAAKAVDQTITTIANQIAGVATENPAALAHLVAYFRVVQSVDTLYQKHEKAAPAMGVHDVQKAAKLVGLRLPDNPCSKLQTDTGGDPSERS
ncbi:hypothetical protein cyc_01341 [Cyclospora cayetanensis]|uniref:Uncharacterized protein n=1 Tax=Cyclospora cayetanensis TaxID=88456 RepID=A0A1D3D1D5_9EIME|nr:hypothetical protein cyc_01341 [Cyclospora cayetanensis]